MSDDRGQRSSVHGAVKGSIDGRPTPFGRREFLQVTSAGALSTSVWWAVTAKTDALADGSQPASLLSGEGSEIDYPYFTD